MTRMLSVYIQLPHEEYITISLNNAYLVPKVSGSSPVLSGIRLCNPYKDMIYMFYN